MKVSKRTVKFLVIFYTFPKTHKLQLSDSVKIVFRNLRGNIPAALTYD